MARRSRRTRTPPRQVQRVVPQATTLQPARSLHHPPTRPLLALRPVPVTQFEPLHDRRQFHPDRPYQPAPAIKPASRKLIVNPYNPARIRFAVPPEVLTCVRRKQRKEVLFAKGVGGQRGRKRRPRFTPHSKVSC